MYISEAQGRIVIAFLEALLPDGDDFDFADVRQRVPERINEVFDARRFDNPLLRSGFPWILRLMQVAPIFLFWLSWRPLPLTWLSIERRQRFFRGMEGSRIYGIRGLFLACKLITCLVMFDDERTWTPIGYDGEGLGVGRPGIGSEQSA